MIETLRTRRSIRKYAKKPVDEGFVALLKEALLRCPSSRGINPWTFVFVDEAGVIDKLSRSKEHRVGIPQGRSPRHRRVRRRDQVGRLGGGLLHCVHRGSPHCPLPRPRKLLDPDQEQGPLRCKDGRGLRAGALGAPEEPQSRGDRRRGLSRGDEEPGAFRSARLRADKA